MWDCYFILHCCILINLFGQCYQELMLSYGEQYGDKLLAASDDGFELVKFPRPIPIGRQRQDSFYINVNGVISGGKSFTFGTPNQKMPYPSRDQLIFPYWADGNLVRGGYIGYRYSTSGSDIDFVNDVIKKIDFVFRANLVFVVTWTDVKSYYNFRKGNSATREYLSNTFQFILASNGVNSYGIHHFEDIQYYPKANDYSYYGRVGHSISSSEFCELPGSGTSRCFGPSMQL